MSPLLIQHSGFSYDITFTKIILKAINALFSNSVLTIVDYINGATDKSLMSMITAFTSTTPSTITSIGDRLTACCQLMEIRSQGGPAA